MKRKFLVISTVMFFLFGIIGISQAVTYTEVGDAGELTGTAQSIGGGFDTIAGFLGSGSDLFALHLSSGTFEVSVTYDTFDPQIFLFDSTGMGIVANDDSGNTLASFFSTILSDSGLYYLGISDWDYDPVSMTGEIFTDNWTGIAYPTGPGGANSLIGWSTGNSLGEEYTIELSQTTMAPSTVPEPTTMLLFGMGLLGLVGVNRRKK